MLGSLPEDGCPPWEFSIQILKPIKGTIALYSFRTRGLTSCASEPLMANPTNLWITNPSNQEYKVEVGEDCAIFVGGETLLDLIYEPSEKCLKEIERLDFFRRRDLPAFGYYYYFDIEPDGDRLPNSRSNRSMKSWTIFFLTSLPRVNTSIGTSPHIPI